MGCWPSYRKYWIIAYTCL